jgi:hypothetical protein
VILVEVAIAIASTPLSFPLSALQTISPTIPAKPITITAINIARHIVKLLFVMAASFVHGSA